MPNYYFSFHLKNHQNTLECHLAIISKYFRKVFWEFSQKNLLKFFIQKKNFLLQSKIISDKRNENFKPKRFRNFTYSMINQENTFHSTKLGFDDGDPFASKIVLITCYEIDNFLVV